MNKGLDLPFGIEVEFTGITRKTAATVLEKALGPEYKITKGLGNSDVSDEYEIEGKDGVWFIVDDASIPTIGCKSLKYESDTDYRVELITPILRVESLGILENILSDLIYNGARINEECSVHIHIDASKHTIKSLKNLLNIFYNTQNLVYEGIGINPERLKYAKKTDETFSDMIKYGDINTIGRLRDAWYVSHPAYDTNLSIRKRTLEKDESRLYGLNLHDFWYRGAIEFRMFNGTLCFDKIKAYTMFCLAITAQSMTKSQTQIERFVENIEKSLLTFALGSNNKKINFKGKDRIMSTWLKSIGLSQEDIEYMTEGLIEEREKKRNYSIEII